MNMNWSKAEWREWAKTVDRAFAADAVVAALVEWPPLRGTVLSYLTMADETDLERIHALRRCRIAITRTPRDGPLSVHAYLPEQLEYHRLGFSQPLEDAPRIAIDEIDVVLVPGLAFDRSGSRLGRGKGYYDELLAQLPAGTIRVGVTVDELLVDSLPIEDHDQRVAWVATESGVHRTGVPVGAATERFISAAIPEGVAPDIRRFPEGTKTSADAAAAVGSELGEIAKSILFIVDSEPVLVIASGDRRIDEEALAQWANASSARIAGLDEVKEITGFVAGGTPAVGLSKSVKVLADSALARYSWVWSAGGTPDTVYLVALDRLIAASGARWAEVADRGKN
jgi:5,10-methenyltetrahydrofolate synthetase